MYGLLDLSISCSCSAAMLILILALQVCSLGILDVRRRRKLIAQPLKNRNDICRFAGETPRTLERLLDVCERTNDSQRTQIFAERQNTALIT